MIVRLPSRPMLVAAGSVLGVLTIGGALTRIGPWYDALRKPSWQPPGWVFGPAWTTIGVLTTCSAVKAWNGTIASGRGGRTVIALFATNGALNIAWSALFFTLQRPDWSMIEVVPLWASVAAIAVGVARYSSAAAWLMVPYLVWTSIAATLNLEVVRLNAPFGREMTA